jgi:N-acetylglutamate synthase-like GNAT family acetyltransferase
MTRTADPQPIRNLTLRRATPSDAEPLQFLFDAALRQDYFLRRGQLEEMLAGNRHEVWLAEIDRVLVGVAVTTRHSRLVNVLVHPAYRGLGVGRALVNASRAAEIRAKRDMSSGDPTAFYQRIGFEPTGTTNERGNIELMRRCDPRPTAIAHRDTTVHARSL